MAAGRTVLSSLILLVAASTCSGGSDRPHEQLSAPPTGAPRREAAAGLVGAVQQSSVASPPAKPKRARLRKACGPDDARCVALRDHECDPYYANVTDTCTFVQYNKQCAADVHHINYLALFYCRSGDGRVFAALFFLAWMGMLFWVMSKAAEDFLVPALEYLACLLRMTPDVAGVTLFAFASGAPDLFTQIAAVAAGGTVDQELAISATLGGGLFIIAVIFSVVVLVNRPPPGGSDDGCGGATELTDRRAFVRDSLAYLLSTLALLGVMLRGVFAAWEASLLIAGYCVYLAVCVLTSRGGGSAHRGGAPGHGYAAVAPSQQQQQQQQQVQLELQRVEGGWQGGGDPGGDAAGFHLASVEISPRSRLGQGLSPRPASSLARKSADSSSAALAAASPGKAAVQRNGGSLPLPPAGSEDDGELAVLVAGLPPSDALAANGGQAPRRATRLPGGGGGGSGDGRLGRVLASATLGLQEMLHTKGKSGPGMWLAMLMSPAVLLLHATMPALHTGHYTSCYALVLSLGAPLFMLLTTGLHPPRLDALPFSLAWLAAAAALLLLMLLGVAPASASGAAAAGAAQQQQQPGAGGGSVAVLAVAAPVPPAPAAPSGSPLAPPTPRDGRSGAWRRAATALAGWSPSRVRQLLGARRPRRNAVLALLASLQCMLWLSIAADELVSLFQSIGRICDFSQDLLGATVLAWGEAVPELVATMTLARQGHATTAVSAVFGGPCFNVFAWAAATLAASLRHKPQPFAVTPGICVLVAGTVAVLAFLLLAVPLAFRWRLARNAAVGILLIYGASQVLFLLAEEFG